MRWAVCLLAAGIATAAADLSVVQAAKSGNTSPSRGLIQQHADVNSPGPDGLTPLHLAVQEDNAAMAELLLRAGANVNVADRYGITPLYFGATHGSAGMLEALI